MSSRNPKKSPCRNKKSFFKKGLTLIWICAILITVEHLRVCWNWQTGTFEGRVLMAYGFKSRHSHQKETTNSDRKLSFLFVLLSFLSSLFTLL